MGEMKYRKSANYITVAVDSATVIEVGDMVYLDTDDVKPVSTAGLWDTNLLTTQENLRKIFLGIAQSASASGETDPVLICTDGVFEMDAASATYEVGDTVAPDKDSGNNLLDQTVEAVAGSGAIGRVYKKATSATRVMVHFKSMLMQTLVVPQSHIADAKTDYTTGDLDIEAEQITAFNSTNGTINSILAVLEKAGLVATS